MAGGASHQIYNLLKARTHFKMNRRPIFSHILPKMITLQLHSPQKGKLGAETHVKPQTSETMIANI